MLLLCFIPLVACEKEPEPKSDLIFAYNQYRDDYSVSINPEVRWTVEAVTIPATYEGKPVTFIEDFHCANLVSITLPEGITHIGMKAFFNCKSLIKLDLPDSLLSIDFDAFHGCDALIKSQNGACYVDNWLVDVDTDLTYLQVREGTVGIAGNALDRCNIKTLALPASLTRISNQTFRFGKCPKLESITVAPENPVYHSDGNCLIETATNTLVRGTNLGEIPAYVKVIGEEAFHGSELQSIVLPNGVTTISAAAFYVCVNLESITLPNTLTTIEDLAFCYCSNLKSISIPEGVTTISSSAFLNCQRLVTAILPSSVTTIEEEAFADCTRLDVIVIPAGVKAIPASVFENSPCVVVYYCGTDELDLGNAAKKPTVCYYKEEKPTENHNDFWHYVDGIPTVWQKND